MIVFENVSKAFRTPEGTKVILKDANIVFPSGVSVGLIGRNGAGKTTIMDMISGIVKPDSGVITRYGTISWTVGFAGSFNANMTGAQNTKFIARVYGVDTQELMIYVQDFAELGHHFHLPLRSYSAGMKSRLAFGISIGIPFDTYLVDEVTSVGDASFKLKSRLAFIDRMQESGAIVVTHSMKQLAKLTQAGVVLENGRLTYFENVKDAINRHQSNMGSQEDE
ncbi:ABC transporter ATP-binding protein [Loktanella salsilacus]|jgi:capsular polysaccharide transport system ATP-binding protein|uniref:ABC transporter ATP-binding protein n=1 Tax=Loktanella salsilacus TaxID=195913 RepID=UPI0030037E62